MSGKFHFQADLKGLRLPVTFTIPDMPESLPFKEPLGPRHSWIFPDKDSRITETATEKLQSTIADTVTSSMHTNQLEIDSYVEGSDLLGHLSDLGITIHNRTMSRTQTKYRWFHLKGTNVPLDSPSNLRGMDKVGRVFQLFDIFAHAYYPASGHASNEPTTQLWVWGPIESSRSGSDPQTFSWEPVTVGYVCPGPGGLQGRHLVIRGQGEPAWVSGSTLYRRYKDVHPY